MEAADPLRAAREASTPDRIQVSRHTVPFEGLPEAMEGRRLVQISDLHQGSGPDEGLLVEAVRLATALDPDYIALTGDVVNGPCSNHQRAGEIVAGLRARRGVYAVLGNHDQRGDPGEVRRILREGGARVLHNAAVELAPGFWIAGVDDIEEGVGDLDAALANVPPADAGVLLAHNPNAFRRLDHRRQMLVLSGHTHSGQWHLPFLPPLLICLWHLHTSLVEGWYRRGRARIYVNRGIGVTGPRPLARRIRCLPEVTEFTFARAPQPEA